MKGSFFTPMEQIDNFFKESVMYDQEGMYVAWLTRPEVIKRILPPPMEPMPAPLVIAYIINIEKPTFCPRYTEAACAIPCTCKGVSGVYWVSFMLGGAGAEMGTVGGREVGGIPKKHADKITVERTGNYAKGTLIRHGIKLFEVEMDICGRFNNAAAANVYGTQINPGDEALLNGFFYKFDVNKGEDGQVRFTDASVLQMAFATTYNSFEKASASIKFEDSIEDPWSELEVVEVLGGGWAKTDIDLAWSKVLDTIEPEKVLPYLASARYDKGVFNLRDVRY